MGVGGGGSTVKERFDEEMNKGVLTDEYVQKVRQRLRQLERELDEPLVQEEGGET